MDWQNVIMCNNFKPNRTSFCRQKKQIHYAKDFICLDTETSWNHDYSNDLKNAIGWVYQWCFSYQGKYIIGRTIPQLLDCFDKIREFYTNEKQHTICYIHNLSYDLQYIKDFLFERYGNNYKMLAVAPHKFISFSIGGIEFRCSYKLSNRSLYQWGKDLNVKHKKIILKEGYDKIRYPESPLNKNDWKYQIRDVFCMNECIEKEMEIEGDKHISQIPLTSTGYVRREGRKTFKNDFSNNRKKFLETRLDHMQYVICRRAFMGGLTHANRHIVEKTVTGRNVKHRDFVSHYPSQQRCSREFPISKFEYGGENLSFKDLDYLEEKGDLCYICKVTFKNIFLKNKNETLPYISSNKCREGKITPINTIEDNGRIIKCDGLFSLYLTHLDLKIIRKQYEFEYYNVDIAYTSQKGYLPKWFQDFVDKFFYEKSYYKELSKKDSTYNINLMKSKNKLNGIYGMTATDIIRTIFNMSTDGEWSKEVPKGEQIDELLDKYYKNKNSFLPYQFGLFTTANARYELMQFYYAITCDGKYPDLFLYCDTDSHFYIETYENKKLIDNLNNEFREKAEKRKEYIETDKKRYYYHSFELEPEEITEFRTLHSKCYAYNEWNKDLKKRELKCVIAGVTSKKGNLTRENELGTIENLRHGFEFTKNGGTRCLYIEKNDITNSCALILPVTKKLNNLIDHIEDEFYEEI